MKKKFIIVAFIIILVVAGLVTSYIDSARVRNGVEPKYTIKIISDNGNKVTYWGLGYKVIRYPAVSPKESFKSSLGVKFGSWFMNYKLSNYDIIDVELLMDGQTIIDDYKENNVNINNEGQYQFVGTIIEAHDNSIVVEPEEGTNEKKSSDKISMKITRPTSGVNDFYVVGNKVRVTYNGVIMESYPAQISAINIELVIY